MHNDALKGGFSDPPTDSARAFRSIMTAMAQPGDIKTVVGANPPAPLSRAAGTLVLTLCDPDTPIYLAGKCDSPALREWIAFHVGAPIVDPARAMFAVGEWGALQPISAYSIGSAEFPDRSASLIVESTVLKSEGQILEGPGIEFTTKFRLPETTVFIKNATCFPQGLDFYFTAGDQLAALPRSTKVSVS